MLPWVIYHLKGDVLDCQLQFSSSQSQKRLQFAYSILGEKATHRLIAAALYLLGARRSAIANFLNLSGDTLKSFFSRFLHEGIPALHDGRTKIAQSPSQLSSLPMPAPFPTIEVGDQALSISFGTSATVIQIPLDCPLLTRAVLLSFCHNQLLTYAQVSPFLHASSDHLRRLSHRLFSEDLPVLIDGRQGATQDFRVSTEVKAELVQQFVLDLAQFGHTSGQSLSDHLKERCHVHLPARTVRFHLQKMGLSQIKDSLPELLKAVKKTPESDI